MLKQAYFLKLIFSRTNAKVFIHFLNIC